MFTFPAEAEKGSALPSHFSSHALNQHCFQHLLSCMLFSFLCLCLVISLFKVVPMHSAEVLFSFPVLMKAARCPVEKIHVLDKLSPDTL